MSKREKIIVICAFLMVLYGISNLYPLIFSKKPDKNPKQVLKSLDEIVINMINEIKTIVSKTDIHIIKNAASPFDKDPFSQFPLETEIAAGRHNQNTAKELKKLIYFGYIETINRIFAVIDGIEYEKGDELPNYKGWIITEISPSQVIIGMKQGKEKIVIPFTEDANSESPTIPLYQRAIQGDMNYELRTPK